MDPTQNNPASAEWQTQILGQSYVDGAQLRKILLSEFGTMNASYTYKDGRWVIKTRGRKLSEEELETIQGYSSAH